jgi:filamentous hemagglutinin
MAEAIVGAERRGSGLKPDPTHRAAAFPDVDQLASGKVFAAVGGDGVPRTLLQAPGEMNGKEGIFEFST